MALRPALRRSQTGLLAITEQCSCLRSQRPSFRQRLSPQQRQQRRLEHSVPRLGEHESEFQEHGVGRLFSKEGYNIAWTEYQGHMVERLNDVLAQNEDKRIGTSWTPKGILISAARDPAQAAIFNYASMAHNNHFFFSTLTPQPNSTSDNASVSLPSSTAEALAEASIPPQLLPSINLPFGSLATLKSTMLATANGMFGPGFVWLVQHKNPSPYHPASQAVGANASSTYTQMRSGGAQDQLRVQLRILTTYLAGSPYPGAHTRQQPSDLNTQNIMSTQDQYEKMTSVQNRVGAFGGRVPPGPPTGFMGGGGGRSPAAAQGMANIPSALDGVGLGGEAAAVLGGANVVPLMCVNTWEHCWLHDYGVRGKKWYLETWWDHVDWEAVWQNVAMASQSPFKR